MALMHALTSALAAVIDGLSSGGTSRDQRVVGGTATRQAVDTTEGVARTQVRRIRAKCKKLRKAARRAGGVFADLEWQSVELAREAQEAVELWISLRRAYRDARRQPSDHSAPLRDPSTATGDDALRRVLETARSAQQRLNELLAESARHQQICLTQLDRIEDLVDATSLAVAGVATAASVATAPTEITQEVEDGLQAARTALAEVQQTEV